MDRVLLIAMYRLDDARSGPTLRIAQLSDALGRRVRLDIVSGTRVPRAAALLRYAVRAKLRGLAGIYVESSSALPGPVDLLFLALARSLAIPVLTYIRDAYQLFPEYYPLTSIRRRLSRVAFRPVFKALARASTTVAFPSRGLAVAVLGDGKRAVDAALLPPGSRVIETPIVDPSARRLLYVGNMRQPASGGELLLEAVARARERGHDIGLICVAPAGEGPSEPFPDWLEPAQATASEIEGLLNRVLATVIPRRRGAYNDLAVPVKLYDYLAYGRPLIVTDVHETAAIVRKAGCGLVVDDTVDALAEGIAAMTTATPAQIGSWGKAALRAASDNTWDQRAVHILELLRAGR